MITTASDIFSLGRVLAQLCEADPIFAASADGHLAVGATRLKVREVRAIIAKAGHKIPGARYSSAMALAADMERVLAGGEVPIEIVTPTSASIEFKQFGILLNIKPTIDRNDNIRARVETEISAVDKSVSVGNTPGFLTRRTDADILLHSGETLVMSGLVDRELDRDLTGLKGLSSLPILGHLFRSRDFRDKKTDLVIFVTPQVYDAEHKQNIDAVAEEQAREAQFLDSMHSASFKLVE